MIRYHGALSSHAKARAEAATKPEAGGYSVELVVHSECTDCQCDEAGVCQGSVSGLDGVAFGNFTQPTAAQVEVFIEPCVFGCAED